MISLQLKQVGFSQLISVFDLLPDVLFWVKDEDSRIIHGNRAFIHHLHCERMEQVLSKTDFDFSPPHLAMQYVADDKRVMAGHEVIDRLELNYTANGRLGWFSTSKQALRDEHGVVRGTYGITRHLNKTAEALANVRAIEVPVRYVLANYHRPIPVEELAAVAHLSVSALERRFTKHLSKTPQQFINEVRLENARRLLLESIAPVVEVAYQCGFSDPSYFSKQFHRSFGVLPSQMRKAKLAS